MSRAANGSEFYSALLNALESVRQINVPSSGSGIGLEVVTLDVIKDALGIDFYTSQKALRKDYPYSAAALRKLSADLDPEMVADPPPPYLIKHPFGTQKWPEFVIQYAGRFLAIEVKSSSTRKIIWNGGLPRQDCIYIYHYTGRPDGSPRRTTVFSGNDVITREVYDALRVNHRKVQDYSCSIRDASFGPEPGKIPSSMGFSEYARAMYIHSMNIHGHPSSDHWYATSRYRVADFAGAPQAVLDALRLESCQSATKAAQASPAGRRHSAP